MPAIGMAALGLIAYGSLTSQVAALDREQKAARMVIERSNANEARIEANSSLLSGQAAQIREAVRQTNQTQQSLNRQQLEIIKLLNRLSPADLRGR